MSSAGRRGTVTVVLTVPQAEALWYAARYMLELDPAGDGPDAVTARVLKNGQDKITAALDGAAVTEDGR